MLFFCDGIDESIFRPCPFLPKKKKKNVTRCPARFNWPHKLERGSLFLPVSNPWKMNAKPKSVSLIGGLIRWPTGPCLPPAGFQFESHLFGFIFYLFSFILEEGEGGKLEEDGRLEGGEMGFECNEEAAVEF